MKSSSASKASRLSADYTPEKFKEMNSKYKDIISTLPKREPHNPPGDFYQYNGFWFTSKILEGTLFMREHLKAQPSDIFICSSQKTGTTWLKALTFSIMTRLDFDEHCIHPLLTKLPHECLHTLEMKCANDLTFLEDSNLPLFSTHIPYDCLPPSIIDSDCKIVYICREPKDTFVSMWHFRQNLRETSPEYTGTYPVTLEQEYKWFIQGKSNYGPYWDHVSGYWKASRDRPNKVLFLKYEDLKSDTFCYVNKLAHFMGKPFSQEEQAQGVPESIVARCRFESLSNLEVNKSGWTKPLPWVRVNNSSFFRKGEIGDWRNLLTDDMVNTIDHITREKFQPLGLTFPDSSNNTHES